MEWIQEPLRKYAEFDGRATRQEYWMWVLCNFGVSVMLILLSLALPIFIFALFTWLAFILIPGISVLVRRLHDTGSSGGWFFISLLPLGGLALLFLLARDGDVGSNKYGPDPKVGTNKLPSNSNPSFIQTPSNASPRENLLSFEQNLEKSVPSGSSEIDPPALPKPRPTIKMNKSEESRLDPPIFE